MKGAVLLLCVVAASSLCNVAAEPKLGVEHRTSELMGQILAAVSAKSDDHSVMEKLCNMVNEIEHAVHQITDQEGVEYDYEMARLRAELVEARKNITTVRNQYNLTVSALRHHEDNMHPVPQQLADAKSREQSLLKQRELLQKECEKDVQGQRFRVDSVKSDLAVLDEALSHLVKLAALAPNDEDEHAEAQQELIQVDESAQGDNPYCDIPKDLPTPITRCQNGFVVPITDRNGSISTFPPGNGMQYHSNLQCAFRISPADAGPLDRVQLNLLALATIDDADVVKVYEGGNADEDKLLVTFTGRPETPATVRTKTASEMLIVFSMGIHDDAPASSPGFVATYQAIQIPTTRNTAINLCPGTNGVPLTLTGDGGFIAEDSRPEFADALQSRAGSSYSDPLNCAWMIVVNPEERVRLHFTFLKTEVTDFLTVYDGASTHSNELAKVSGANVPGDISSSGSELFVTYAADYAVEGSGFHLSWCVEGKTCPELPSHELPDPVTPPPTPSPTAYYNESAPEAGQVPPPTPEAPQGTPIVNPPEYPVPTPTPVDVSCCPADCNNRGICNSECQCACYTGYSGNDCSVEDATALLEVASEVGCEDDGTGDFEHVPVTTPNLDPVRQLLEQLKYELFRSLTYEHDTANVTRRQCQRELRQQDKDLEQLQQEVLSLEKLYADMDTRYKSLTERRDELAVQLKSLEDYATELMHRIDTRKSSMDSNSSARDQELKTLQSMRDIITELGGFVCTRDVEKDPEYDVTPAHECYGELLDTSLPAAASADECVPLCTLGCAGFSYNSQSGCRFYSDVRELSAGCAGDDAQCACHKKRN